MYSSWLFTFHTQLVTFAEDLQLINFHYTSLLTSQKLSFIAHRNVVVLQQSDRNLTFFRIWILNKLTK